jgi:glycosyltransferase involved in cell wall biosynthesis
MKIGVCIPCHSSYVQYLERLIYSIEKQTVQPSVVCISISGVDIIPSYSSSLNLLLIHTSENKNAGQNRNIAANEIYKTVDVITFMDADDYMHPRRIESLHTVFSQGSCDVFLHAFCSTHKGIPMSELESITKNIQISGTHSDNVKLCGDFIGAYNSTGKDIIIANGHISCISSVFPTIQVNEHAVGYEDSLFTGTLFARGYRVRFTEDMLSLYCRY